MRRLLIGCKGEIELEAGDGGGVLQAGVQHVCIDGGHARRIQNHVLVKAGFGMQDDRALCKSEK